MKKLLLLSALLIFACSFGQGGQLHANGTAIDQDGNNFEWINYGTQNWAIENAEVVTYRDGTIIPQVDNPAEWSNLTTGAWCYSNGDPNNGKLYNWYAVAGIYDLESLNNISIRKELAPDGWRVPTDIEWTILEIYLIHNGYNFDETFINNKIAKSMSSTNWIGDSWLNGAPGNNSQSNNLSGFNAEPKGFQNHTSGNTQDFGHQAVFWSISDFNIERSWRRSLWFGDSQLRRGPGFNRMGFSVRFLKGEIHDPFEGNSTDQDGNNFEWINYGTQNWAIENAEVVTYRDGTIIPQVDNPAEWSNLTTGAWCYSNGDPNNGKLYNWYAVAGIYDLESLNNISIRKELAPDGWRVPTDIEWTTLETFLISSGFNYDRSTSQNKIAGVMASIEWGSVSSQTGAPGYNSNTTELNNSSRFKAEPDGRRGAAGIFIDFEDQAIFWSLSESSSQEAWRRALWWADYELRRGQNPKVLGFSIRFVRDVSTASTSDNSTINFKIFPNPTKEYLNIDCSSLESVSVYNILGKELMKDSTKRIDVSSLSKGVYFIKVFDGINTSTKKFIKD